MNKKQTTILMLSLIILTGGLFTGCGNTTTSKAENTTSTQVQTQTQPQTQKVEDKQEALKKELTPFLTDFANAGLTFDYTKYTVEDYKKIKDFETADSQKLEVDQKFTDQVEKIKKAKGIAKVEDITINSIDEKENIIYVEFTAKQNVISYIDNGKDYSNSVDNVKIGVTIVKENNKFLVDSYAFNLK